MKKQPSYIELMEQHELLFSTPVTEGSYLWRERGIEVVNKACKILEQSVVKSFPHRTIRNIARSHPMLLGKNEYDAFFKKINPYGNNFGVNIDGGEFLVRPDITYLNGKYLSKQADFDDIILGGVIDIYRQVKAKALMIDQQIWPLIFFAFADSEGRIDANIDGMIQALGGFYDSLLLPHIWTIHDGYEQYADRLAMPLMAEDSQNLTVMSTVFGLSDIFSTQLKIKAKLFELGVTEKTFAIIYIYQSGNEFIFLPSSINPTAVVLDNSIESQDLVQHLSQNDIGYKRISMKGFVVRRESSKGNSLLLIQGENKKIKMINLITQEEIILDDLQGIQDGLNQGDARIYQKNTSVMTGATENNIFQVTCKECIGRTCSNNNWLFNGDIYPQEPGICGVCGKQDGKKRMFLSSIANSRAKEKSK